MNRQKIKEWIFDFQFFFYKMIIFVRNGFGHSKTKTIVRFLAPPSTAQQNTTALIKISENECQISDDPYARIPNKHFYFIRILQKTFCTPHLIYDCGFPFGHNVTKQPANIDCPEELFYIVIGRKGNIHSNGLAARNFAPCFRMSC